LYPTQAICLFTIFLLLTFSAHAQRRPEGSASEQDIQNREWALTHITEEVNSHFKREEKPSPPQIREDFQQLQIVNNEMMKRVFVQHAIEPKRILSSVAEIKKRAARLKAGLAFGEIVSKSAKKPTAAKASNSSHVAAGSRVASGSPAPEKSLSSNLLLLDHAVMSFVSNPLFQQPRLFDVALAMQADHDLDEVMRLAEVINRVTSNSPPAPSKNDNK